MLRVRYVVDVKNNKSIKKIQYRYKQLYFKHLKDGRFYLVYSYDTPIGILWFSLDGRVRFNTTDLLVANAQSVAKMNGGTGSTTARHYSIVETAVGMTSYNPKLFNDLKEMLNIE